MSEYEVVALDWSRWATMRSDPVIKQGFDALCERVKEREVPLCKLVARSKRDALGAIKNGQSTVEDVRETTDAALRQDLDFAVFLQVMGARIAAEWAAGERDSL